VICARLEAEIDEAGPRDVDGLDIVVGPDTGHDGCRQFTRVGARCLGEAHCDVTCKIAVADVARSLHRRLDRQAGNGVCEFRHIGEGRID
jgi:hypothetical protein